MDLARISMTIVISLSVYIQMTRSDLGSGDICSNLITADGLSANELSIDPTDCEYYHYGCYDKNYMTKSNIVDYMYVGQEMELEFYFTINTKCIGTCNILGVGSSNGIRLPAIYLANNKLIIRMSNDLNSNYPIDINTNDYQAIVDGKEHLFYFKFTKTNIIVKIDNNIYVDMNGNFPNNNYQSSFYPIYITTPWHPSADVSLRDICISSNNAAYDVWKQWYPSNGNIISDHNWCTVRKDNALFLESYISQNEIIDNINIGNTIIIEFKFTLFDLGFGAIAPCNGYCNVLQIGDSQYKRLPAIYIKGDGSGNNDILELRISTNTNSNFPISLSKKKLSNNREYQFTLQLSPVMVAIWIDGISYSQTNADFSNTNYHGTDYPVYLSNPWETFAKIQIRDLCIFTDATQISSDDNLFYKITHSVNNESKFIFCVAFIFLIIISMNIFIFCVCNAPYKKNKRTKIVN